MGLSLQWGELTPDIFLRDYWQQKPCLLKQALPDFENPHSGDELAGLACEDLIESKLITAPDWNLQMGPFEPEQLENLPQANWTLHVQGIDSVSPEAFRLLDYFRFIPNWRLDDVMVSFSADGGSAGPHFDRYDVFLVQTQGSKAWQIGQYSDENTPSLDDVELCILKEFKTQHEWLAEPGDVIYIPPHIAHYGISRGTSTTYSIGFRAPAYADMLADFSHFLADSLSRDQLYQDKALIPTQQPGLISPVVLKQIRQDLGKMLDNDTAFSQWFGEFITRQSIELDEQESDQILDTNTPLYWTEGSRFAYTVKDRKAQLYVNGEAFDSEDVPVELIAALCQSCEIVIHSVEALVAIPSGKALLERLLSQGLVNQGY